VRSWLPCATIDGASGPGPKASNEYRAAWKVNNAAPIVGLNTPFTRKHEPLVESFFASVSRNLKGRRSRLSVGRVVARVDRAQDVRAQRSAFETLVRLDA
jgi:hypothetical protein